MDVSGRNRPRGSPPACVRHGRPNSSRVASRRISCDGHSSRSSAPPKRSAVRAKRSNDPSMHFTGRRTRAAPRSGRLTDAESRSAAPQLRSAARQFVLAVVPSRLAASRSRSAAAALGSTDGDSRRFTNSTPLSVYVWKGAFPVNAPMADSSRPIRHSGNRGRSRRQAPLAGLETRIGRAGRSRPRASRRGCGSKGGEGRKGGRGAPTASSAAHSRPAAPPGRSPAPPPAA